MRMSCWTLAMILAYGTCAAADGALDGTFGNYLSGISRVLFSDGSPNDKANAVLVQPDGKLVLVGMSRLPPGEKIAITRLTPSGALDVTFGNSGLVEYAPAAANADAYGAVLQSDGKIVTVGSTGKVIEKGTSAFLVCRFGATGVLDSQFGDAGCAKISFNLGGNNDGGLAIAIDKNSRIVVAGFATTSVDSGGDFAFARLNTDGTPDSSFGFGGTGRQVVKRFDTLAGTATSDMVRSLVIQQDGRIIGVGSTSIGSTNRDFAVARLDATGLLDATYGDGGVRTIAFDFGGSKDDVATAAAVQADGKLVIAGYTTWSATDTDYAVVRLDAGGDLDPGFGTGGKLYVGFDLGGLGPDQATAVSMQSDGKILVAGYSHNSASGGIYGYDVTICRLQPNSWLDNSFGNAGRVAIGLNLDGANNDHAYALALQGGRPILAGSAQSPPSGNRAFVGLRLENALIFTNDFDP